MRIYEKLANCQKKLVVKKDRQSPDGKYVFRNVEDILYSLKPILEEEKLVLILTDKLVFIGNRFYIEATALLTDAESGENISTSALARESNTIPGMEASQITGSCSSYARKYALGGLFAIDNGEPDPDSLSEDTKRKSNSASETTEPPSDNDHSAETTAVTTLEDAYRVKATKGLYRNKTLGSICKMGKEKLFWTAVNDEEAGPAAIFIIEANVMLAEFEKWKKEKK